MNLREIDQEWEEEKMRQIDNVKCDNESTEVESIFCLRKIEKCPKQKLGGEVCRG